MSNNQKDAAVGLGFILAVVLAIIFGNDDWIGAGIGLAIFTSTLATAFIGAAT